MWLLYALTLAAGIANAVQAGWNGTLARSMGQPFVAALVTFAVSAVLFLAAGLATGRLQAPSPADLAQVPWWGWCGGVLGAVVVASQLFVSQRVGAAPYLGLLVTAGVVTSLVLDHFGWAGFPVHPAGLWRIVGGGLMIAGVALVALT